MKQYQYEFLINKICRELNVSGSEKNFAYDVFINRISENLRYDELIRIPKIGFFQLKKGNQPDSNSDTLVFVPFNNLSESEEFAFVNIPIKKKEVEFNKSIEELFTISINKPVISISSINSGSLDYSNSLFKLQKYLEESINELIKKSDFFEGLNLWEDFVVSKEIDFIEEDNLNNEQQLLDEKNILPNLVLNFDDSVSKNKDHNNEPSETNYDEELIEENDISNIDTFLNENLFNDIESTKEESDDFSNVNSETTELIENNAFLDEVKLNSSDELSVSDELNNSEDFDFDNDFNIENLNLSEENTISNPNDIFQKFSETTENKSDNSKLIKDVSASVPNDTDWTKELEDELFTDEKDEEQIDIFELKETFDSPIKDEDVTPFLQDISQELNDSKEIVDNSQDIEEIRNDNIKGFENSKNQDSAEDEIETNIDELFDSLVEEKEEQKVILKKKINFKKLLIYIGLGVLTLVILGTVYYFFFYRTSKTTTVKGSETHETVSEKPIIKEKSVDKNIEKEKNISHDSISDKQKTDLQNSENIKKEETKSEIIKNGSEKSPETFTKTESITNTKTVKEETVKPIVGELYKTGVDDRQIAEKIFFDGKKYNVQTSSWNTKTQAEIAVKRLRAKGINASIVKVDLKSLGIWYRVKIYDFNSKSEAEAYIKKNNL